MGSGASKKAAKSTRDGTLVARNGTVAGARVGAGGNELNVDSRLPFPNFRELFTLKNYWKTVRRNEQKCANLIMFKYLKSNPNSQQRYDRLRGLSIESAECSEPAFEKLAGSYLKIFDDVITIVEETPADASEACKQLTDVGKRHRFKIPSMKFDDFQQLESPFLYMIQEVLEDRFNEKAENLFRKFFQFCLKYILEGFNQ